MRYEIEWSGTDAVWIAKAWWLGKSGDATHIETHGGTPHEALTEVQQALIAVLESEQAGKPAQITGKAGTA